MVAATSTPKGDKYPDWLKRWETTSAEYTAPVPISRKAYDAGDANSRKCKAVKLLDFTFLGQPFAKASYSEYPQGPTGSSIHHEVAGVCASFKELLVAAQRRIYDSFVAQAKRAGTGTSEGEFADWCDVGMVRGYRCESRGHGWGMAIDIDPAENPWVVTGQVGGPYGGEARISGGLPKGMDQDTECESQNRAVVDIYNRAVQLRYGEDLGERIAYDQRGIPTSQVWTGFSQVHFAVTEYFQLAFYTAGSTSGKIPGNVDPLPWDYDNGSPLCFLERFRRQAEAGILKGAGQWEGHTEELYQQIVQDFPQMRLVLAHGKLTHKPPKWDEKHTKPWGGIGSTPWKAGTTRDPRHGFLRLRKEIAAGLRHALYSNGSIHWGACDLGRQCGDLMHFQSRKAHDDGHLIADAHQHSGTVFYAKD